MTGDAREEIFRQLDVPAILTDILPSSRHVGVSELSARCPFHDDHNPSLSVNRGTGLFYCHACGAKGSLFDLYAKVKGLTIKQTFDELQARAGLNPTAMTPRVTGRYDYQDEHGNLLYWKERLEPGPNGRSKEFRFYHGDRRPSRGQDYGVLYRLPSVLGSEDVIVVEGEKHADFLAEKWGLVATTLDAGAQSRIPAEMAVWLSNKKVLILPDNDKPGREYARRIAEALYRRASSIRIIMLPGLPEKGDILDWVQVPGNDRKRLLEVAGETAEWTPQQSAVDLPVTEVVEPAWDEPIHFCEVETPELSVDIFPEWMRDYARAVIDTTQTPPGLTVGMGLAVLAACLQKRFEVVPFGDDYAEPVALWMLTALESGNRKTAVKNALTFPLSDWERVQAQDLAPAIRDGETRRSAIEKRIINLTSRAAGLDNREEREALYREINALKMEIPPTVIPPRVWTDNTTPERLENLLVENDERIALISDEGGIFEVMAGLYTNGRVNINVFLQGHAGGEIRVERQGRQVYLNRPAVTFGLAVQPSVVADLSRGDKRRFRGVGALARFLYILPKSNIGNRDITRRVSIPEGMRGRYALGITDLLDIKPVHDEHGQEVPRKLRFDAEALRLWENFAQFIEENMGSGKELHAIQDWASKLPGAAARIAGLLHVARHRDRCSVIGTETMSKALDLSGALITHALTAFQLMGSNEAMNDARGILDWVMGTRPTQFTRREAQRAVRALEGDRLDKALKVLVDRNFIGEPTKRGGGPGKGPPSTVYVVNPRMYETFS